MIALNGRPIDPPVVKGYATITRKWKRGDKIELQLPMLAQRIVASDKIEATRGRTALRYGPLVYNVERVDQDISRAIDPKAPLSVAWKPDLLEGVMAIEGRWVDGERLLAIPNYARCNREENAGGRSGPSSVVWIRVDQ